jgi:hypothetical protein
MEFLLWLLAIAASIWAIRLWLRRRAHRKWLHETLKVGAGLRKED